MEVRVRLFAQMAAVAGVREVKLEMAEGSRVDEVAGILRGKFPEMKWPSGTMVAVNQEYACGGEVLKAGDEVAVIPPVSGG